eukprot:Pgem_evm1s8288
MLDVAKTFFLDKFLKCEEFMRHKETLIDPKILINKKVPFYKTTQEPGQFVITFPRAFHA